VNYGCENASDALAAYALDALPELERLALLEHLAECRLHDEQLAGFRAVAGRLPLLVASTEAPPQSLRANLLDAFDREQLGQPVETVVPAAPSPVSRRDTAERPPSRGGFWAIFRQPSLAYGMAAALLIAVLGLAAWNVSLQDTSDDPRTTAVAGPNMTLKATYYPKLRIAVLDVDMPEPPAGQVYQAWMIADGQPVSVGVLYSNKGTMAFAMDMGQAQAIALSLEPAGGSVAPTTQPIVIATF
jgi:anti-sigma-K factor RskA